MKEIRSAYSGNVAKCDVNMIELPVKLKKMKGRPLYRSSLSRGS